MRDEDIAVAPADRNAEELCLLRQRRDALLARRTEVQGQLDARVARDDALLAECDRRQARITRNLTHYAMYEVLDGLFRLDMAHAAIRTTALRLNCFGPPEPTPTPPDLPPELQDRFTLGGRIPIKRRMYDNTYPANHPLIYTDAEIDCYLDRIAHGEHYLYGTVDFHLWQAFAEYPVAGRRVAVMGSATPWYEATCLRFGAEPTSIDYNPILVRSRRIRAMTLAEWERDRPQFDAAVSISSFEHDGLGAYGDPIDPDGDLKAMRRMKEIVKPGGLMFFNVPHGADRLNWNRLRVYGPIRLPMLLDGWTRIASFGMQPQFLDGTADGEPLLVLRNDPAAPSPTVPDP
jgi:hypothetical protein